MVEVNKKGKVRSATHLNGTVITDPYELDMILTIEQLYAEVRGAIRERVETLVVEWNFPYGHPSFVFIDRSLWIADEEVSYEISEFEVGCDD